MTRKQKQRVSAVIAMLDEQCGKLRDIYDQYSTGYDAAFDEHGAGASLKRWVDRTRKLIQEHIGSAEAINFKRSLTAAPRGRGSWHWGELCNYLHTCLVRLIEDIEEHPDDPTYDKLSGIAPPTTNVSQGVRIQYDVFLSYSTHDKDEVHEIHAAVIKAGKTCFLAEKNLKPGDKFRDEIRDALEASGEIWILVSPRSIKSDWVRREASAGWALKKRMVPILLRCGTSDLPDELADAHAIDYHKAASLIAGLKSKARTA